MFGLMCFGFVWRMIQLMLFLLLVWICCVYDHCFSCLSIVVIVMPKFSHVVLLVVVLWNVVLFLIGIVLYLIVFSYD